MFGREDEKNPSSTSSSQARDSKSVLGAGTQFVGNIRVQGSLKIDGDFQGEVECRETLEVGKTGAIQGNLTVKQAAIAGKVAGNIQASERIELREGSHLEGDIVTRRLVIDEGVFFEGNCRMGEKSPSRSTTATPAASTSTPPGTKPEGSFKP